MTTQLSREQADTLRQKADEATLATIIPDAEIERVHANANFGSMGKREVVNESALKVALGYHIGGTARAIMIEHGLATNPDPLKSLRITKKGKQYARLCYVALLDRIKELEGEVDDAWRQRNYAVTRMKAWDNLMVLTNKKAVSVEEWGPGEGDVISVNIPGPESVGKICDELLEFRRAASLLEKSP